MGIPTSFVYNARASIWIGLVALELIFLLSFLINNSMRLTINVYSWDLGVESKSIIY